MAAASPPLPWCHFLPEYLYLHPVIYLAGQKRGPLPTYYLPQSHHHIYNAPGEEGLFFFQIKAEANSILINSSVRLTHGAW